MTNDEGRRAFSRSDVAHTVEVETPSGATVEGTLADLSMKGLLLATGAPLTEEGDHRLTILLQAAESNFIPVRMTGRIARRSNAGTAFELTAIDGDSVDHLHKLVLYNNPDPEAVEEETEARLGLRRG